MFDSVVDAGICESLAGKESNGAYDLKMGLNQTLRIP